MTVAYSLLVQGVGADPVRVLSFRAREAMSACYEVTIECVVDASRDLAAEVLGRRATLDLRLGDGPEVFHGVIHSVRLTGHARAHPASDAGATATYSLALSPRLWLLKKKRRSRVFAGKRVDEIVQELLNGAHIPAMWLIRGALPVREYCTQYEETDEEFIRRILAEAGVMFFFLQPALPPELRDVGSVLEGLMGAAGAIPGVAGALDGFAVDGVGLGSVVGGVTGEVLVFADDAVGYHGIGEMPEGLESLIQAAISRVGGAVGSAIAGAAPGAGAAVSSAMSGVAALAGLGLSESGASRELAFRPAGGALSEGDRDSVQTLTLESAIQSEAVIYTTFDPRRPHLPLSFSASGDGPIGPRGQGIGAMVGQAAGLLGQALPPGAAGVVGTVASVVATGAQIAGGIAQAAGASGGVSDVLGAVSGAAQHIGGATHRDLTIHEHHDPFLFPDWEYGRTEPARILAAERRDRSVGRGESRSPLLSCGRRFTLVDHPVAWLNHEYAIVEIVHEGRDPGGAGVGVGVVVGSDGAAPIYRNTFTCVPSGVAYLPLRPRRRTIQTCLTATVIAPESNAEIATHGMAEVKVKFHWEQGDTGTCWIRTMQAWSGAAWGTQFMPRAGMEVVVGFDGGDPDRPIVLGCVYNAVHPAPFSLPAEQTKSGIRTQSTPNGEGHNELSFEDRQGAERVYVHAERDLDVEVEHDRTAAVLHDDGLSVENDRRVVVKGAQHTRIDQGQDVVVRKHRRIDVEGTDEHVTRGHRQETIIGSFTTEVRGPHRSSYGGAAGEVFEGDVTREAKGCVTEIVRRARMVRVEGVSELSCAGPNVIESEKEVVLRCGESTIRIAPDRIEICSPKVLLSAEGTSTSLGGGKIVQLAEGAFQTIADTAQVVSSGASLGLSSEAKIDGAQILLNSPDQAKDAIEEEKGEPTVIELQDDEGKPVPNARYRIELGDGTARTGRLDDDGRAEVMLEGSAEIVFPDLSEVQPS